MVNDTLSVLSSLIGLGRALENENNPGDDIKNLLFKAVGAVNENNGDTLLKNELFEAKKRVVPSCFVCASPCGHNDDYPMDKIKELDNERTKEIFSLLNKLPDGERKYSLVIKSLIYISSDFEERYINSLMGELHASLPGV